MLPDPAVSNVADNGQQPDSSVRSTESFKPSQRSDIRLLNNVLGLLVSFDDPPRQVIGGIQVRKEKFLEKRLCVSHLRQDHAISLLFPFQVFFFPSDLGPGSAAHLICTTSGVDRYRFIPGSQSRRRTLSLKLEKATAKGLNSGHLVQPNPQDSPGFRERKFILGSDESIIDCPGIERGFAPR